MDARRRRWIAAGSIAAAGVLVLLLLWPRDDARTGVPGPEPPPVAAVPTPPPAPTAPPGGAPEAEPGAEPELPEAVRRYLARTEYPPSSGRLTEAHADLLRPNRRHESRRPVPDALSDDPAALVTYLLTADRYHLEGGGTIHASLDVWRGGDPIPDGVRILEATAQREGRGGFEGEPVPVRFVRRGDRLEAEIPLDPFGDHHGPIVVSVRFGYDGPDGGGSHEDTLRFFHTPEGRIPARLTRNFHDYVADGSLRVEVGVRVDRPGFYRFDANVLGEDGAPVAFAAFKGELGAGEQAVPLEVFGKVLRDAGVPGPYVIRDVRGYRFLDGQYPDREQLATALDETWTTSAYALDEFTDEPWTSEHKQRMVELMLEDVARGLSLDVPGEAPAGGPPGDRPPDDDVEPDLAPLPDDDPSNASR